MLNDQKFIVKDIECIWPILTFTKPLGDSWDIYRSCFLLFSKAGYEKTDFKKPLKTSLEKQVHQYFVLLFYGICYIFNFLIHFTNKSFGVCLWVGNWGKCLCKFSFNRWPTPEYKEFWKYFKNAKGVNGGRILGMNK